ncbi:hypothetical protein [Bacillus pseudomycoides]|nr:hypothetical protein [Bacillus pseudomycoides]
MKNYDVIAHAVDVVGAKNDLESCVLDLESHRKKVYIMGMVYFMLLCSN